MLACLGDLARANSLKTVNAVSRVRIPPSLPFYLDTKGFPGIFGKPFCLPGMGKRARFWSPRRRFDDGIGETGREIVFGGGKSQGRIVGVRVGWYNQDGRRVRYGI